MLFDLCWPAFQRERKRETERTRIPEARWKKTLHQDWPCLLAQDFKGAGWNWKEVGSKHLSHLSLASLSWASWGRLRGHRSWIRIPGLARCPRLEALTPSQCTRTPFSAKAGWWFFLEWQLSPSPQAWTIFWQAYVLQSYRWCRHGLEVIPAGPPPRSLLITHQIRTGCSQNPGSPSCSEDPASREARASEKLWASWKLPLLCPFASLGWKYFCNTTEFLCCFFFFFPLLKLGSEYHN